MKKLIKQFISYFCVGGIAALVEWGSFFLFNNVIKIQYLLATVMSFCISTYTNFYLGKKYVFKDQKKDIIIKKETFKVYFVSFIGLIFNIFLMKLFVETIGLEAMLGKILATGIVFMWNFIARKIFIYKN